MKKTNVMLVLLMVISLLCLGAVVFVFGRQNATQQDETGTGPSSLRDYQDAYVENAANNKELIVSVMEDFSVAEQISEIYQSEFQDNVRTKIDTLIAENSYTEDHPLVIYNPFLTNTQSLYVYFESELPYTVSYSIHIPNSDIADFGGYVIPRTITIKDSEGKDLSVGTSKVHEFQITGIMPDENNMITIRLMDQNGIVKIRRFYYQNNNPVTAATLTLTTETGMKQVVNEEDGTVSTVPASDEKLTDGMFVTFAGANEIQPFLRIYENSGLQRAEIPLIQYGAKRMLFQNGIMYYQVSDSLLAGVDVLGQAVKLYSTAPYKIGNDYALDANGNLLVLCSDVRQTSVDDCIVQIDEKTGEITELVDLGDLLSEYKSSCVPTDNVLDWLGLSSIEPLENNMLVLSAKTAGAIIKLRRIYNDPRIVFMIGDTTKWAKTSYLGLFLRSEGGEFSMLPGEDFTEFTVFPGVTYTGTIPYDKVRESRRYLYLLNNNAGATYGKKEEHYSYYDYYVVDEAEQSVRLVTSKVMPEVTTEGSLGWYQNHLIMTGGMSGEFYEYDPDFQLITKFVYKAPYVEKTVEQLDEEEDNPPPDDTVWYTRVFKYDFLDYYFKQDPVLYVPESESESINE